MSINSTSLSPSVMFKQYLFPVLFAILLFASTLCAMPVGTYRYIAKPNFGAFYDGGRTHLPRSASTFFASQIPADRPFERRDVGAASLIVGAVPDVSSAPSSLSSLSSDRSSADGSSTDLSSDGPTVVFQPPRPKSQPKGQLARKNCFFSPLQCSFYYKKRDHGGTVAFGNRNLMI